MNNTSTYLKTILSHELYIAYSSIERKLKLSNMVIDSIGLRQNEIDEFNFFTLHQNKYILPNHQVHLEKEIIKYNKCNLINWDTINHVYRFVVNLLKESKLSFKNTIPDIGGNPNVDRFINISVLWVNCLNFLSQNYRTSNTYRSCGIVVERFERLVLVNNKILTTWDFFVSVIRCQEYHTACVIGLMVENNNYLLDMYICMYYNYLNDMDLFGDDIRRLQSKLGNYPKFKLCLKEFPNDLNVKKTIDDLQSTYANSCLIKFFNKLDFKTAIKLAPSLKNFGYITINCKLALDYFKELMSTAKCVSMSRVIKTNNTFKWIFLNNYIKKLGVKPKYAGTLRSLDLGNYIPFSEIEKLKYIKLEKNIDYDYSIRILDMIKDTACMPGKHYLWQHFNIPIQRFLYNNNEIKYVKNETRRFPIRYLQYENIDHEDFLKNARERMQQKSYIIKYDLKLKEHKPQGREFGTLTFEGKLLQISRIQNIKNLFRYFDDYTGMTKNNFDLERLMSNKAEMLNTSSTYFLMIDFKDYAGTFSYNNMGLMLKEIDNIYDSDIYEYFCELSFKCDHVLSFGMLDAKKQYSNTSQLLPNGFDQYCWSLNTISLLVYELESLVPNMYSLTLTGDNCAIVVDLFKLNTTKSSETNIFYKLMKNIVNAIRENGQEVKEEEFIFSTSYFEYLKRIYYRGVKVSEPIKNLQKLFINDSSDYCTIYDELSDLASNCSNLGIHLDHPSNSYIIYSVLYIIKLFSTNIQMCTKDILINLFSPSLFGKGSSLLPTKFFIIGDIDPLTDWCYWISMIEKIDKDLAYSIRTFNYQSINFNSTFTDIKKSLILDPYSLPINKINTVREFLKEDIIASIPRVVKNNSLGMLTNNKRDDLFNSLVSCFDSSGFDPLLSNLIYTVSNVGCYDYLIGKITKSQSYLNLIRSDKKLKSYDEQNPLNFFEKLAQRVIFLKSKQLKLFKNMKYTTRDIILNCNCSRLNADKIRAECMPGFYLLNLSTSHPLELINCSLLNGNQSFFNIQTILVDDSESYFGTRTKKPNYTLWDNSSSNLSIQDVINEMTGTLSCYASWLEKKHNDNSMKELLLKMWSERFYTPMPKYYGPITKNITNKLPIKSLRSTYLKMQTINTKFLYIDLISTPLSFCKQYTINYELLEATIYLRFLLEGATDFSIGCIECITKRKIPIFNIGQSFYKPIFIEAKEFKANQINDFISINNQNLELIITISCDIFKNIIIGSYKGLPSLPVYNSEMVNNYLYFYNICLPQRKFKKITDYLYNNGILSKSSPRPVPYKVQTPVLDIPGLSYIQPKSNISKLYKSKGLTIKEGEIPVYNLSNEDIYLDDNSKIYIFIMLNSLSRKNLFSTKSNSMTLNKLLPGCCNVIDIKGHATYLNKQKSHLCNMKAFQADNKYEVERLWCTIKSRGLGYKVPGYEKRLFNLVSLLVILNIYI